MDLYESNRTKYDIPLNHLDYEYIKNCKNVKELEKIIKILRSGIEGTYAEMEKCAENKLAELDPKNKLLRKPDKLLQPHDLDKKEWNSIKDDLENWVSEVKMNDIEMARSGDKADCDTAPPVRGASTSVPCEKQKIEEAKKKPKSVKPREYREWDKVDVEAELEKISISEEPKKTVKPPLDEKLSDTVDDSGLSDQIKQLKANHEKDKGNEAFRVGDYDEALTYYNRSISLLPSVAACNNRAQTYIKMKKWNKALDDCNSVLKMEPDNLKATLRRAVAYKGLTQYVQAKKDLLVVVSKEPSNKHALSVLKEVDKALEDQKTAGRRMVIEEVEGSDNEDTTSEKVSKNNKSNHEKSRQSNCVKNAEESVKIAENKTASNHADGDKTEENAEFVDALDNIKQPLRDSNESDEPKDSVKFTTGEPVDSKIGDSNCVRSSGDYPAAVVSEKGDSHVGPNLNEQSISQPPPPLEPDVLEMKNSGNELFRTGQYADALHKYDSAIARLSGDKLQSVNLSVLYSNRAACKFKTGDCRGCVDDCDLALDLSPGAPKPLLRRAMAFETLERFRQAYVDYKQVLMYGANDQAQQGADRCASMLQQLDGPRWREKIPRIPSLSSFSQFTSPPSRAVPEKAPPKIDNTAEFEKFKTSGNSFFAQNEYEKAIECFTRCIELFPDKTVPYTNRALCYLRLNQYEDVLNDCNQALILEFHNVKALFRRALAYKMIHKYEESLVDIETLLKIDPTNKAAKNELVLIQKMKEDMQEKKAEAACLREHQKLRHRMKIKEVESSSEEEDDKTTSGGKTKKCHQKEEKQPKSRSKQSAQNESPAANHGKESAETTASKSPSAAKTGRVGSAKKSSSNDPNSSSGHATKLSPFEFMQALTSLKSSEDPNAYVALLEQIEPCDLPKVISNKLEGELLLTLTRCVGNIIKKGKAQRGFEYLQHLVRVQRFDMIAMFLSESDKSEIKTILEQLNDSINSKQLEQIRAKFCL